jgi:5,10-methylenetetrahydromethanopterin reductase
LEKIFLKYGLGVNVNETVPASAEKGTIAEKLGYDYVWVSDVPDQRYAPVVASVIAARTKRIRIGLGLLSPFVHSPQQIASSVTTLVERYGDRFELCIGPGDRNQLKRIGIDLSQLGNISKRLLAAKKDIKNIFRKQSVNCPIFLGAQGPRLLGIARFFDGVLLNYGSSNLARWAVDRVGHVEGRDFECGVYALSYVYAKHDPRIHRLLKISCLAVALGASKFVLRKMNIDKQIDQARKALGAGANLESILDLVDSQILEFFSIHMQSNELSAYLARLSKIGIEHVVFGYPQNYSKQTIQQLSEALRMDPGCSNI